MTHRKEKALGDALQDWGRAEASTHRSHHHAWRLLLQSKRFRQERAETRARNLERNILLGAAGVLLIALGIASLFLPWHSAPIWLLGLAFAMGAALSLGTLWVLLES